MVNNSLKILDIKPIASDCPSIAFDNKRKERIRSYVIHIKSKLDDATIDNERLKNSIFSKLNAFSAELDKTRTSLQTLEAVFIDVTYAIAAGCKNLEPAYKLISKVMKSCGKIIEQSHYPQLPPPDDHKLLPPPNKNEEDQ